MKQVLSEQFQRMSKLAGLLNENEINSKHIITQYNIYYIDNPNKDIRDLGFQTGVITEPELMEKLWKTYQDMTDFKNTVNSGGDKYTNMFNTDIKADEDQIFFGETLQVLMDHITLYIPKGVSGTKEKDVNKNYYNNIIYGLYYDDKGEGLDFIYSQQEAFKYKYDLMDDDFKEFVDTIKNVID
jgi:hypothetical protein